MKNKAPTDRYFLSVDVSGSSYSRPKETVNSRVSSSLSFKAFIGILVLIMFISVFSSFKDFLTVHGTVTERVYNTNVLVTNGEIDMTSFDAYNKMTPPLATFSDTLTTLEKVDTILSSLDVYEDFIEWSKINTPELYKMKYGNFWQKAVWEIGSIFTRMYYRIFVKLFGLPSLITAIIDVFS